MKNMKDTSCLSMEYLIENEPSIKDIFRSGALMTGLKDLDNVTGGFAPGELICIAGRHSMGVTGLALSMVNRACIRGNKSCIYFTLAEDGRALMRRLVFNVSQNLSIYQPQNERMLRNILGKIERSHLFVNESAYTVSSIEKTIEKQMEKIDIDFVIIDYHQLIKGNTKDRSLITLGLKKLARKIRRPVIVLCQLDNSIDKRDDHTPHLTDLRGVGEIDNYADKVLFLYRDDYYNMNSESKGQASIFVVKNTYAHKVGKVVMTHKGGGIFG